VLEYLGLQVTRLIRLSYGPFQLGNLARGEVDEVSKKILGEQLGNTRPVATHADRRR
jgi:23S rRNA pseudouridine2605 synthase